jgi:hypothetical protein
VRKHLDGLIGIDYFPHPARAETERRLHGMEAELRQRQMASEPGFAEGEPERLDPALFQNRLWATRRNLWVDRLASAWLIRRFIDPQARFHWLAQPQACPPDALGFDFDGARFSHLGRRVTFETLLASFGLEGDAALKLLAQARLHQLRRPGRADFASCTRNWSSAGAGSPSGASCMRSTTACCCPARRPASWRSTSAG